MPTKTPIIAFGPNPDVYYIALGMRYYAVGMPPSVQGTIKKWPAIQMTWMSIEADGAWIAREGYTNRVEFDTRLTGDVIQKFKSFPPADYVTFGPNKGTWIATTPGHGWIGNMENEMITHMNEVQAMVGGPEAFDQSLNGILFGKGTTMIFMFKSGFSYYTDREAEGGKMEALLNDYIYRQPPWTVERGSSLCPWNVDYFFLKFKDPQTNMVQMHWSLPQTMADNLADLTATMNTPEAQQAIANHEQFAVVLAQGNLNLAIQAGNALKISTGAYEYRPW